nr:metal-sensing transcriptional repressor [Salibacterium salarium]
MEESKDCKDVVYQISAARTVLDRSMPMSLPRI